MLAYNPALNNISRHTCFYFILFYFILFYFILFYFGACFIRGGGGSLRLHLFLTARSTDAGMTHHVCFHPDITPSPSSCFGGCDFNFRWSLTFRHVHAQPKPPPHTRAVQTGPLDRVSA